MESEAVDALVELLKDPDRQVRWEVAKALGEIANPRAAPALLVTLEDEGLDIRWLAAEGLIALGPVGLAPLLEALVEKANSAYLTGGRPPCNVRPVS